MDKREKALQDLIELRKPVEVAVDALTRFDWDSPDVLFVVRRDDALRVIDRYLSGALTAADAFRWADALEGREDVDIELLKPNAVEELIFVLANPLLTEPWSPDVAGRLRQELMAAIPVEDDGEGVRRVGATPLTPCHPGRGR
ncbi:MAG: hypothetical protein AB7V42_12025 [Thermoleophilia bacterium]